MAKFDLVGVYKAAKILDRSPQTVRRYEALGKLPAFRVDGEGGPRVFMRADVERLAEQLRSGGQR